MPTETTEVISLEGVYEIRMVKEHYEDGCVSYTLQMRVVDGMVNKTNLHWDAHVKASTEQWANVMNVEVENEGNN